MVSLVSLWLPILLSSILVFIVSSMIHTMLQYHKNDFKKLPDEDGIMNALRNFNIPPGDYIIPSAGSAKAMKDPEFIEKAEKGPVAFITVMQNGIPKMGKELTLWFVYILVVNFFAAYITSHALSADAHYLSVFRFIGATAFMGYSFALWQSYIWYKRSFGYAIKTTIDGLIYALLTAGVFGWLW